MEGVKAKMHNGTLIYFADEETPINFAEGGTNFTLNATLDVKGTIYLPGGQYLNNIFLQFAADPDYEGSRYFQALIGIRPFNRTAPDDDDDLIIPDSLITEELTLKHLTFNEKILIGSFIFGILAFFCMKNYCIRIDAWLVSDICPSRFRSKEDKRKDLESLTKTQEWQKIKRLRMIANEAMVDFDEQDDFEEEDDSATEDEKVTPWSAVTDDGKTPDGHPAEVMKKIEDEVMEVAHGYDVRTYRKYCVGDPLENTESFSMERPADSGRVYLINNSGEAEQVIEDSSNNLGLQSNNTGMRIAKKGSAQPFDMAADSMTFSAD